MQIFQRGLINSWTFPISSITVVVIYLTMTLNVFSQTVEISDWKIKQLKIHSISETTIQNIDSLKTDTFISYKAFYNTNGSIIEQRYDYRDNNKYTSEIYQYSKQGKLIGTKILNPKQGVKIYDDFIYSSKSVCKYFDAKSNLIKLELVNGNGNNESANYHYVNYQVKDNNENWSIMMPSEIDYYFNGILRSKKIIQFSFY